MTSAKRYGNFEHLVPVDYFTFIKEGAKKVYPGLPEPYDLVMLLTEDEIEIPGWYIGGGEWGGYRYRPHMKIKAWRKKFGLY